MDKKKKLKSHRHRRREKLRDQGKELWADLLYEGDQGKELWTDLAYKGDQGKELRTDLMYKGEGLPEDIVYEILIRLPAHSLTKFRCVCKQWCSLISHHSFQQNHYRALSRQDPLLLITKKKIDKGSRTNVLRFYMHDINDEILVSKFSKTLPPLPYDTDILLVQTCQGFLCFVADYYNTYIFLCNPSTREFIALPPTNEANDCVAFGFTESTRELKLVRFFRPKQLGGTKTLCQVFTLKTSKWIEARCPQNQLFSPFAYFIHGAIHLQPIGIDMGPIHAFNIETEEYRLISLPELCDSPLLRHKPRLGELAGFLCLTIYIDSRYEFWLLKDYNNGMWTKEYTIDCFYLPTPSTIFAMADGRLLLQNFVYDDGDGWLCSYNPHDRAYTRKSVYLPWRKATLYVGSLFPLCR